MDCCSKSEENKYDLAVIGAGSAGFSAAITAAEQGANVVLIGYGTIGGSCVNVGCVPSKTLIRGAETIYQASQASRFNGIDGAVSLKNWKDLVAQKDDLVQGLRKAKYEDLLPAYDNITYMAGFASFDGDQLTVDGTPIKASKIIIVTGSRASIPPIPGIEDVSYLTSTEALDLTERPDSMLIIGGGYIGCELAQMFSRLGVKVTIVCRSRLLPEGEPEISEALTNYFRQEGIKVVDGLTYDKIGMENGLVQLTASQSGIQQTLSAEKFLVTAGRTANVDSLNLEAAGINLNGNGGIAVDDNLQTSKEGIYAAGDVTGRDQFVYMAAYGAKIATKNALNGNSLKYDATVMPAVTFTDPQVATVGLTEQAAISQGIAVKTSTLSLEHVPRALAARDVRGVIKLVADETSNRLIGAHIIAPEGADSIQTAVIAIKAGMTVTDLAETIFPYLTTVEGLKLAAQTFDKDIAKLSCCAG